MNLVLLHALLTPAHAADTELGFAVDTVAGAMSTGDGAKTVVGLREVEGDIAVAAGAFRARADLELGLSIDKSVTLTLARAEQLTLGVDAGTVALDAGVAPGPWRVESVDPWANALVTIWPGTAAIPAQVLGATVSWGAPSTHLAVIGGWSYAANGINLVDGAPGVGTPIVGVHGQAGLGSKANSTRVTGGLWTHPGGDRPGGFEVGARVDVAVLALQTELLGTFDGSLRAQVGAEALSRLPFTPVARLSWDGGPGVALGARVKPLPMVALKAQGSWEQRQVAGWLEAAIYHVPDAVKNDTKARKRKTSTSTKKGA